MQQQGHAPATADLMRHCVEMFFVAAFQKLTYSRFTDSDIEEVITFLLTPFLSCRLFNSSKLQENPSCSFKITLKEEACSKHL